MTMTDETGARRAFGWWLRHTSSDPSSYDGLRRQRLGEDIEDVLLALRDDTRQLPTALRQRLGPLLPPTYDAAARLLLWARHAPRGPRCRSYRAALYLVRRLERDDVARADVEGADLGSADAEVAR